MPITRLAVSGPLLLALACSTIGEGSRNEDTGLVGVPVREGALAGVWAQRTTFATVVEIPLLGERESGGSSTRLVHRSWDEKARRYTDTFIRCSNDVIDTEGAKTIVKDATLAKVSPVSYGISVSHAEGTLLSDTVVDLWGVRNLPDPEATPLPLPENFESLPQSEWIWDEDEDGHPGVTVYMRGALSADLYVCKRSLYLFEGTVLSEDRIQGLIRQTRTESNSVASTVSWMAGEGHARPHPEALRSWFDMVRLPDDADCAAAKAAAADGRLASAAPF